MPMLQIAVCDDEPFYKNKIKELLEAYLNPRKLSYSISLFDSGAELLVSKRDAKSIGYFGYLYSSSITKDDYNASSSEGGNNDNSSA